MDFPEDASAFEPESPPEPDGGLSDDDVEPADDKADDDRRDDVPVSTDGGGISLTTDPLASSDAAARPSADAGRDAAATPPAPSGPLANGPLGGLLGPGGPLAGALPAGLDLGSLSPPRQRACMAASDCTVSCFPVGFVSCCRLDHVCGCSWAPGAYCL